MSLIQLIECVKCGNQDSRLFDPNATPWDVWPNGCPECGGKKVDVTLVLDKSGRFQNLVRVTRPNESPRKLVLRGKGKTE